MPRGNRWQSIIIWFDLENGGRNEKGKTNVAGHGTEQFWLTNPGKLSHQFSVFPFV